MQKIVAALGCIIFILSMLYVHPVETEEQTFINVKPCSMLSGVLDYQDVQDLSTPSSAIMEEARVREYVEWRDSRPKKLYFGTMATTGYLATGNPCADGAYPCVGWTVACNDPRLWHKTIYIEGVGTRYVHDTGGMASTVLDVFVGSISEAYAITSGSRNVYILE